uniref:Uncharacterized protein n=1 Tax=Alexandrium catenella TaxID=2925 RepID=A0A7S1SFJ2_ALECA
MRLCAWLKHRSPFSKLPCRAGSIHPPCPSRARHRVSGAMAPGKASKNFFDDLIKELETKVEQIDMGIKSGNTPTRKELENFTWKTGRIIRLIIKPEASEDRKIFWHESKGFLKQVLNIDKFNPGVFTSSAVREDIIESGLLSTLRKLLEYAKGRKEGKIAAPDGLESLENAAKRIKLKDEKKEEEEQKKKEEEASKKGWVDYIDAQEKWKNMAEKGTRWDEEESDADEPCPDIKKHGSCSYGRQCCFCEKAD